MNNHLTVSDLPPMDKNKSMVARPDLNVLRRAIHAFEKGFIYNALCEHNWNITHTAKALEVDKSNLLKKMKYHNIVKPV
jgi:transcriptional regulator of acetoin/glycerol metabolism